LYKEIALYFSVRSREKQKDKNKLTSQKTQLGIYNKIIENLKREKKTE